ncbi:hypothetical protein [Sabulicella rubraurantiaca]|uniref:hypothetical protein n=1 Tax=Sabulicella rubraurantiaca TaxID=2811429 RepID=UPI001A967D48|nr:hypothetical protein [Sabulicella rubraurantiaca]
MSEAELRNLDRLEAEAAKWAYSMLFSEPLKLIAAAVGQGPVVGGMLSLITAAQILGYIYLAGRVGAAGGITKITHLEPLRFAAILAYALYVGLFFGHFVVQPLLGA